MLNKLRKLKEKKGFTLVELIVVIAIIANLTAVLVPLIGNWTQQAAYTTLQDGAQTISNSINNALSKVSMGGAPASIVQISATKTGNTLSVSVDATAYASLTGTNKDIADEVSTILSATLPNDSAFLASIASGAVDGVIYRNDDDTAITAGAVSVVSDFDNAFEYTPSGSGSTKYAAGVSGKFKGAVTVAIDATTHKVTAS